MPYTARPRNGGNTNHPHNIEELVRSYLEACRILADPNRSYEHAAKRHFVKRVQSIWAESPDYFRWPALRHYHGFDGLNTDNWQEIGLLKVMGYVVGENGEPPLVRRMILDHVCLEPLPRVNSAEYMAEWGEPRMPERLRKLAYSIKQFAELHINEPSKARAVRDWLADLDYLHDKHFVPMMVRNFIIDWSWP